MGFVRLKGKVIAHKHCTLVNRTLSHKSLVNNSETTIIYTGIEQVSKWIKQIK